MIVESGVDAECLRVVGWGRGFSGAGGGGGRGEVRTSSEQSRRLQGLCISRAPSRPQPLTPSYPEFPFSGRLSWSLGEVPRPK